MLDQIASFVERGFAIHWLKPRSKAPAAGAGWSSLPVASLDDLRRSHKPNANVGVRPGLYSKIGDLYLHLIDVDIRTPDMADEAHAALRALFPDVESWPRVVSGSGGASRHYYFLTDRPFSSKKLAHSKGFFKDAEGHKHWHWEIELFGTGKQAAMPPSIHPDTGKPYRWEVEFDFDLLDMGLGPILASSRVPSEAREETREDGADDEDYLVKLVRQRPLGLSIEEIREDVMSLPVEEWCEDRDGWLKTGMAIHHETGGSQEGYDVWVEFSLQSGKFDESNQRYTWRKFGDSATPVTMATVKAALKETGAAFQQCLKKLEGVRDYASALRIVARFELNNAELSTVLPRLVSLAEVAGMSPKAADVKKDLADVKKANDMDPEADRSALESWIAEEFLRIYFKGDRLLRTAKTFWHFDRGAWRICDDEYVGNRVYRFMVKLMEKPNEAQRALLGAIMDSGRAETLNALVNSIVGIVQKAVAEDASTDPLRLKVLDRGSVMNCRNGELWFPDGKKAAFKEHDPDNRLTVSIDAEYDPEAECPEWDAAIEGIFADTPDPAAMRDHLHEVMGYCLQTSRTLAAWFLFHGSGANGKSFVASVLQTLLGEGSTSKSLADFSAPGRSSHLEAGLVGKLLLVDDDFKKGAHLPDDTIKKLSETKTLTANPKFAGEFGFACRSTPMILSNHWPQTSDLTYGLTRRAVVIPFTRTFDEHERDLGLALRVLRKERSGILNRCVAGWDRLRARGHFTRPQPCVEAMEAWMGQRNALSAYLSERLDVTGDPNDKVWAEDLWNDYRRWVELEGARSNDRSRRSFLLEVGGLRGVLKYTAMGYARLSGIRLKPAPTAGEQLFNNVDVEELI